VNRCRKRFKIANDKGLRYNIFYVVEVFENLYMSVLKAKITGNPMPTDLINTNAAKYNGLMRYKDLRPTWSQR